MKIYKTQQEVERALENVKSLKGSNNEQG